MNFKQVSLLCIVFFIGYGVSYVIPPKYVVDDITAMTLQDDSVAPMLQLKTAMPIKLKQEPKVVSVAKIMTPEKSPTWKAMRNYATIKEMYGYGTIGEGVYNKGDVPYDNYLFPIFQEFSFVKFQVQGNKLLADATDKTRDDDFPTIRVYTPEYNDDTIYQQEKNQVLTALNSEEALNYFGEFDDDFSAYATEVFSNDFSDNVYYIYNMRCRKALCVFFAKLNRTIDRKARIELRKEIKIKKKEIINARGFAPDSTRQGASISYSDYSLELRVSMSFKIK